MAVEAVTLDHGPGLELVFRAGSDQRNRDDAGGCGDTEKRKNLAVLDGDRCSPFVSLCQPGADRFGAANPAGTEDRQTNFRL